MLISLTVECSTSKLCTCNSVNQYKSFVLIFLLICVHRHQKLFHLYIFFIYVCIYCVSLRFSIQLISNSKVVGIYWVRSGIIRGKAHFKKWAKKWDNPPIIKVGQYHQNWCAGWDKPSPPILVGYAYFIFYSVSP